MKKKTVLLMLLMWVTQAQAQILVSDAYVRALPPGVENTSAYMTLTNSAKVDVELVSAYTGVAEIISFHSSMNHNGMIHMMPAAVMKIPAQGELRLMSGGNHLMLEKLREPLVPGSEITLELVFSDGTELGVTVPVISVLDE